MKFQRTILADVEGYVPGEQPKLPNIIKLNTNENPYPPSPKVMDALQNLNADSVRRYPDPVALEFRTACAKRYGYPGPEWVIAGNGMDELLAMFVRTFVDPGDTVLSPYPTYILYETLTKLHGAGATFVDLDGSFQLTNDFYSTPAKLCFFPRPNAPSGVSSLLSEVERFCCEFPGLVVIDEAYADFADDNCLSLPLRFDNVIVARTFSKSFSLAGMRLGVAFAKPEIIAELMKTKDSYNLNAVTQAVGLAALDDYDWMLSNAGRIRAARERLTAQLTSLGFAVPPSQANFILAQWTGSPTAKELFMQLRDRSIVVRYFVARRLENALRISVGNDYEVDSLISALREIL